MKTIAVMMLAMALAATSLGAAQLYRWVDEKGNVEYRDTPPPSSAKKVEQRTLSGSTIETSTMPFSVQQAIKNHPVTLWTTSCGDPCDKARAYLAKRGVPHTERDAQKESAALKKLSGGLEVPVLLVGARQLKGYLESDWDAALDSAGYPKSPIPGVKPQPSKPEAAPKAGDTAAKAPPTK